MKRLFLSLGVVLFLSAIFSCNDSNETPDTKAPEITVVSPAENARVKGMITISATAEDLSNEIIMQVILDGTVLKQNAAKEIATDVNTKTLTEGTHTIKITATDKAGNSSEKSLNFEVRNTLFKLSMPSGYLDNYSTIYFSLSKNDGTLMSTKQIKNGETISIATPDDFNPDSSFVYTQYFYLNYPAVGTSMGYLIKITSVYAGLLATDECKFASLPSPRPKVGSHNLTVSDMPTSSSHYASITGQNLISIYGYFGTGPINTDIDMYNSSSDLYFYLIDDVSDNSVVPKFKYFNNVQAGSSTQFSTTEMQPMQNSLVSTKDATGQCQVKVDGYTSGATTGINVYNGYRTFSDSKFPVFYPSVAFPKYAFDLSYNVGNVTYGNRVIGTAPPSTFKYTNVETKSSSYVNKKMKVVSSGDFDIISFFGGESGMNGNTFTSISYSISFPAKNTNVVVVPDIPSELSTFEFVSPNQFKLTGMIASDYTDLSGQSDYQRKILFSEDNLFANQRPYTYYRNGEITVSGGRVSSQPRIELPKQVADIVKNHSPALE